MIEYRVCWAASSNTSFQGCGDWEEWDNPAASPSDVEMALSDATSNGIPRGLTEAIEGSGFEWWVETTVAT